MKTKFSISLSTHEPSRMKKRKKKKKSFQNKQTSFGTHLFEQAHTHNSFENYGRELLNYELIRCEKGFGSENNLMFSSWTETWLAFGGFNYREAKIDDHVSFMMMFWNKKKVEHDAVGLIIEDH